jgi:hypothetical protein
LLVTHVKLGDTLLRCIGGLFCELSCLALKLNLTAETLVLAGQSVVGRYRCSETPV